MTDGNIELSRRKILAGLGAIGAAGAGAGLGTSALFSDEETFEGNTITAGTLDLKVDWEEHYSYPQLYGFDDPTTELDVTRSEPSNPDEYQAMPDPEIPAVWVHNDDLEAYMDNTSIEAYPDPDGDGIQNDFSNGDVGAVCEDGADTPDDLDPEGLRTDNADTAESAPLVNLEDVKPGDFGELTLSYHLCSNPGYVWLGGELVEASENGLTEPETNATDEVSGEAELLDEIEATVWYDGDCDNVFEPGGEGGEEGQPVDVMLVIDRSGSMEGTKIQNATSGAVNLVDALGPNDQVGLVSFSNGPSLDQALTANHNDVVSAINGITAGGGTLMADAVQTAQNQLQGGRTNAQKVMIVLGDGAASDAGAAEGNASSAKTATPATEIFTIAYGSPGGSAEATLQNMASTPQSDHYFEANISQIESLLQSLGGSVGTSGEELIMRGTLRDVLSDLEDGNGIPLDGDLSDDNDHSPHPGMQTSCVGLSWHLPADTANHVQGDSVQFNVGFYAEQSRNNGASGD